MCVRYVIFVDVMDYDIIVLNCKLCIIKMF